MNWSLNLAALEDRLIREGLNQAQLAEKLGVSREAVSKWIGGETCPTPDKLVRIAGILRAGFDELVIAPSPAVAPPVVYYRRKASRKTKPSDLARARERGESLRRLVPHLPGESLTRAPTLQNPRNEYPYLQRIAEDVRKAMKIAPGKPLDFEDLIDKFIELNAILVPVLWGAQVEHGNALNVYLPDSGTTWVFLNLDSNAVDFKFWMAHELGHSLAPELGEEKGEPFADAFAQALLFPQADAEALRTRLRADPTAGHRINRIKAEAQARVISPLTIRYAVQALEAHEHLEPVDLGEVPSFMGAAKNFGKGYKTITQALLGGLPPAPAKYISECGKVFKTPIFKALRSYGRVTKGLEHYIHSVLGLSLVDSKAVASELRA